MHDLTRLEWEILNATADDIENLEQVYRQVAMQFVEDERGRRGPLTPGFWQERYPPVQLTEVAEAIALLLQTRLLRPVMDENGSPWIGSDDMSIVWRAWFRMTSEGEQLWRTSAHAKEID